MQPLLPPLVVDVLSPPTAKLSFSPPLLFTRRHSLRHCLHSQLRDARAEQTSNDGRLHTRLNSTRFLLPPFPSSTPPLPPLRRSVRQLPLLRHRILTVMISIGWECSDIDKTSSISRSTRVSWVRRYGTFPKNASLRFVSGFFHSSTHEDDVGDQPLVLLVVVFSGDMPRRSIARGSLRRTDVGRRDAGVPGRRRCDEACEVKLERLTSSPPSSSLSTGLDIPRHRHAAERALSRLASPYGKEQERNQDGWRGQRGSEKPGRVATVPTAVTGRGQVRPELGHPERRGKPRTAYSPSPVDSVSSPKREALRERVWRRRRRKKKRHCSVFDNGGPSTTSQSATSALGPADGREPARRSKWLR